VIRHAVPTTTVEALGSFARARREPPCVCSFPRSSWKSTRGYAERLANVVELLPEICAEAGEHACSRTLRKPAQADEEQALACALDHAIPPDGSDGRERGLIVAHIALE
jgi:hypothetical protein